MKIIFAITAFLCLCFIACKNEEKKPAPPQDDIDAARKFIRAALDGKFNEAKTYLLNDSTNAQYMFIAELNYKKNSKDAMLAYQQSSIRMDSIGKVNDSTTVLIFSNSYKNNPDTLKIVKTNNQWLVDLKYLYEHDMDTALLKKRDSLMQTNGVHR